MIQSPFHDQAVWVSRRLNWVVFVVSLAALGVSVWVAAFRATPQSSFLARYGSIGIGMMLATNAAISLLPPKHKARWALWIIWVAAVPVAIGALWIKATR